MHRNSAHESGPSHDQAVSNAQSSLSWDMTSLQSDASSLETDRSLVT